MALCGTRAVQTLAAATSQHPCQVPPCAPAVPRTSPLRAAAEFAARGAAGAVLGLCLVATNVPGATAAEEAVAVFGKSCAGCHAGGGNVIRPGLTLRLDDLQKQGYVEPAALYQVIYAGRGSMPGFGTDCAPKGACTFGPRLADGEVQALADYVLKQAEAGWPQS